MVEPLGEIDFSAHCRFIGTSLQSGLNNIIVQREMESFFQFVTLIKTHPELRTKQK